MGGAGRKPERVSQSILRRKSRISGNREQAVKKVMKEQPRYAGEVFSPLPRRAPEGWFCSQGGFEMRSKPQEWLVFRLGALGDVVLLTGVLDWWHKTRGLRFSVVTKEAFAPVLQEHPAITRVIPAAPEKLRTAGMLPWFTALAHQHQGQGLLDLHGTLRSEVLSFLWRGPVRRYPKKSLLRRMFLLSGGKVSAGELREFNVPQRYAMALETTPPAQRDLLPVITLRPEESAWARARLEDLFWPGVNPLALHPFATHSLKAWPAEYWRDLAAQLDAASLPWFFVGLGQAPLPERRENLSNTTTLRECAALLSQSRLLVTGDSGPMHMACGVGAPVLAMFGPTTREWGFYPAGPKDRVLEADLPCRPCSLHGAKPCPRQGECLKSITPAIVFENILEMLNAVGKEPVTIRE